MCGILFTYKKASSFFNASRYAMCNGEKKKSEKLWRKSEENKNTEKKENELKTLELILLA